MHNMGPWQR